MTRRYFVDEPIAADTVTLAGPEAHHLLHVMRAKPGDEVVLFDGSGDEFPAQVETLRRAEADLNILRREAVDRELPSPLILGVALPKGDRQRWLIEKAVELGVSRVIPLETAHSVAQPTAKARERLRRAVIEASKQCGRNRLMEIAPPESWNGFLASNAETPTRLVAQPNPGVSGPIIRNSPGPIVLAVGPEGGFSDAEGDAARNLGWSPITLGPRILRVETAALALAASLAVQIETGTT